MAVAAAGEEVGVGLEEVARGGEAREQGEHPVEIRGRDGGGGGGGGACAPRWPAAVGGWVRWSSCDRGGARFHALPFLLAVWAYGLQKDQRGIGLEACCEYSVGLNG